MSLPSPKQPRFCERDVQRQAVYLQGDLGDGVNSGADAFPLVFHGDTEASVWPLSEKRACLCVPWNPVLVH